VKTLDDNRLRDDALHNGQNPKRNVFLADVHLRRCCRVMATVPLLQMPSYDVLGWRSDGVNLEPFVIKLDFLRLPHCRTGTRLRTESR
jgi:hypothetical protein